MVTFLWFFHKKIESLSRLQCGRAAHPIQNQRRAVPHEKNSGVFNRFGRFGRFGRFYMFFGRFGLFWTFWSYLYWRCYL